MTLRFSVVISSYNYGAFIEEAVDSVLAQRHAAAQLIVVDDGSSDGTLALLARRYGDDARVTVIAKDNGGQLSAFIAGVRAADGDIVCFLDADDRWEPDHLSRLAAAYADPAAFDAVHTNLRCFGNRDHLWHADTEDHDLGLTALQTWRFRSWHGSPSSALSMRRELAVRILDLPQEMIADWRVRADDVLIFGASLLAAHKAYLAAPSVGYRVHGHNHWMQRSYTAAQCLRYEYRLGRLIAHFVRAGGLTTETLRLTRREFETRSRPDAGTFRQYRQLAWSAPLPFGKRLELVVGMLRHYLKTRHTSKR